MKSFNETDLIAFHLHELSPQQELAVRTAISLDPSLAAESEAIAETLKMFDRQEYPTMIGTEALDNNWLRLRPSLTPHRPRAPFAAWGLPLTLAVAVTALLVIAFWFSSWTNSSMQQGVTPQISSSTTGGSSPTPTPPPAAPAQTSRKREAQTETKTSLQSFSRFAIPSIDPTLEPAPLATNLAFANLPSEPIFESPSIPSPFVPPASSSATPTPPPISVPTSTPPPAKHPHKQTDISIGVFGNLVATRNHNFTDGSFNFQTQSATPSAGIVGAFHQQFRPWLGYRVATSYTHSTLTYSSGQVDPAGTYYSATTIPAGIHELTAAYTAQGPSNKKVTTDAELGGGVLVFVPSTGNKIASALFPSGPVNVNYNYRRTGVGGVGVNFHISRRLDLRTEYRALVYEAPSFRALGNTHYTVTSEPAVSLTYHFGKSGDK